MAYNPDIPQPNDLLSESQPQVQENFELANTYFGEDHVAFNAGSNNGKHNHVTALAQGSDPTNAAGEISLYSKGSGTTTRLYVRQPDNTGVYQLTGDFPTLGANKAASFLPGQNTAYKVKFGKATILNNNTSVTTGFVGQPFVAVFSAVVSPSTGAPSVSTILGVAAVTGTNITIRRSGTSGDLIVFYQVMGT